MALIPGRTSALAGAAAAPAGTPRIGVSLAALLLATACGRGGGSGPSPSVPDGGLSASSAQTAHFLTQATFGPRPADIAALEALGFSAWIDGQMALPASLHEELTAQVAAGAEEESYDSRVEAWWRRALFAEDQLRQRVAFALSQILVISDQAGAIGEHALGMANYYDILVRNALGNYRELLEEVARSPLMGGYLSMLQNPKPDSLLNVHTDENFAREVMQLFSIGLVMLNPDGTPALDHGGNPTPTYDQDVVVGMAHALTGWNFAGAEWWDWQEPSWLPMQPWEQYHETGPKLLVGGHQTAGGETPWEDLELALDLLFEHPNVGPFLGRQLIQRLVTSNPSPAFVARVAAVFDDDGSGERGDLGAVVRAILLDPEAMGGAAAAPQTSGKVREPLLRLTALWRAFGGHSQSGWVDFPEPEWSLAQAPLRAPTVFNFYRPDHSPPGELTDLGLHAPELQIATHTHVARVTNALYLRTFRGYQNEDEPGMVLDVSHEIALAADPATLVEHLDVLLLAGEMSAHLRAVLLEHLGDAPPGKEIEELVRELIFLVVSSAEGAVQK